jgi:hypothetical protein
MATRAATWDLNPVTEGVTGYNLYVDTVKVGSVGPAVQAYTFSVTPGVRTFGLTAVNTNNPVPDNESDPAVVTLDVKGKPSKPVHFAVL